MKPDVSDFFLKADEDISDAEKIFAIGLLKPAARCTYYGCFHACEGFIFHKTNKLTKTHSGVRSEFARLTKDISGFDRKLTSFLAKAYVYKEICDYGIGDDGILTSETVAQSIQTAKEFIRVVRQLVTADVPQT